MSVPVGTVLAEQKDKWTEARLSMALVLLAQPSVQQSLSD